MHPAGILFCIFGTILVLYGIALHGEHGRDLMPARGMHSVKTKEDVDRVGNGVLGVGVCIVVAVIIVSMMI